MTIAIRVGAAGTVVATMLLLGGCAASGGVSNTAAGQAGMHGSLGGPNGLSFGTRANGSDTGLGLGAGTVGTGTSATAH